MADLRIDTAALIRQWLTKNYGNAWTLDQVNAMFKTDLTPRQVYKIYRGDYVLNLPKFSFYKAPVKNVIPSREITLPQLHSVIVGNYYKALTEQYRAMPVGQEKADFKKNRFDSVTFAGTFHQRKTTGLNEPSGYAVFDFDHLPQVEKLRTLLIADQILNPDLLFVSPSGDGLKMVLTNSDGVDYSTFYKAVVSYLKSKYPEFSQYIDEKTKDISRTCFICHDADAYLKPQYLLLCQAYRN